MHVCPYINKRKPPFQNKSNTIASIAWRKHFFIHVLIYDWNHAGWTGTAKRTEMAQVCCSVWWAPHMGHAQVSTGSSLVVVCDLSWLSVYAIPCQSPMCAPCSTPDQGNTKCHSGEGHWLCRMWTLQTLGFTWCDVMCRTGAAIEPGKTLAFFVCVLSHIHIVLYSELFSKCLWIMNACSLAKRSKLEKWIQAVHINFSAKLLGELVTLIRNSNFTFIHDAGSFFYLKQNFWLLNFCCCNNCTVYVFHSFRQKMQVKWALCYWWTDPSILRVCFLEYAIW